MLEIELRDRVAKFLNTLEVVRSDQVYKFFRNEHKQAVMRAVTNLRNEFLIFYHGDYLAVVRDLPTPIFNYGDRVTAIDVLCLMDSKEVLWFSLDEYPWELIFGLHNGMCYAVTVLGAHNWSTKYAMIQKFRSRPLLKGIPDPVKYIAVVPNKDLIPKIQDFGFSYYATMDKDGHPCLLRDAATDEA